MYFKRAVSCLDSAELFCRAAEEDQKFATEANAAKPYIYRAIATKYASLGTGLRTSPKDSRLSSTRPFSVASGEATDDTNDNCTSYATDADFCSHAVKTQATQVLIASKPQHLREKLQREG